MTNLPPMTEEEAKITCDYILHLSATIHAANWTQFAHLVQFEARRGFPFLGFDTMKSYVQHLVDEDDLDVDSMKDTGCPIERWGL